MGSGDLSITTVTGGVNGSPSTISSSGKDVTVVILHSPLVTIDSAGDQAFASNYHVDSSSFEVGDILELVSDGLGTGFVVSGLVNGVTVTPGPVGAVRCFKIASGTAVDWSVV